MSALDRSIPCEVGSREYVLEPTLKALLAINRRCGSLVEAAGRVQAVDFEAIVDVIAAGANLTKRGREQLLEDAFKAGAVNLVKPVAAYLAVLLDPMGEGEEGDEDEDPDAGKD